MKDKIKEAYDDQAFPSFDIEDMMETIQVSKQIVEALPTPKYVQKESRQIGNILRYHTPKILIAQIVICSMVIIYALTLVKADSDIQHSYFIMLFTGFVCMVSTSCEVIRSQIMGMWEMEKVCKVSPQRILLYKSMIFGTISTILIFLSSFVFANTFHFSMMTLFLYGYIPFLFLTAMILQFSMYVETREAIMGIYVLSAGVLTLGGTPLFTLMQSNVWLLCIISVAVFLFSYMQYYHKSAESFKNCL